MVNLCNDIVPSWHYRAECKYYGYGNSPNMYWFNQIYGSLALMLELRSYSILYSTNIEYNTSTFGVQLSSRFSAR